MLEPTKKRVTDRNIEMEMGHFPKVSIVIPVYNHEKFIRECVESALNQDYGNLEVIVVDDGSTDATSEVLKGFETRIKYIRQENQGAAAAFNHGLKYAQGAFVAWLSSDDVFLPHKISLQVAKLQEDANLALVYTDCTKIDAEGRELGLISSHCPPPDRFVRIYLMGGFVTAVTMLLRRECVDRVGLFDESLLAYEDYDMVLRLLQRYRVAYLPLTTMKYRWHSANMSHKFRILQKCRDRVYVKVINTFSPKEIFGDLLDSKSVAEAYEWLSLVYARQFAFEAASLAIKKSIEESFSLKCTFFLFLYRNVNVRFVL